MKFENKILKEYILLSMSEIINNSFEFRSFDNSLEKMYTNVCLDKGYIEIEFFGREKQWNDETKWVRYHVRRIGCAEILNWMIDKNIEYKYVLPTLSRFAHVIYDEYRATRDLYYSDKE